MSPAPEPKPYSKPELISISSADAKAKDLQSVNEFTNTQGTRFSSLSAPS